MDDAEVADGELASIDETAPDDQQETEEDLKEEDIGDLNAAVLFNTDWTVGTIVDQITKGNISLDPQFQRRNAWDITRKSRLIESLFVGLPIPNIVLAEKKGEKGRFIVIDGKQRLLSIVEFTAKSNPLVLADLSIRKNLEGKNLSEIRADPATAQSFSEFENQSIRTIVIRNWPSEKFLYLIFYRLNSGSLPLSPQELRKALHPGRFLDFVDEYLAVGRGVAKVMSGHNPDRRMRDSELVLRYVAFELFYPALYDGNFKRFLDETVKAFNVGWSERESVLNDKLRHLDEAIDAALEIFGLRGVFRKWNGERFENRLNRAVFDAVARYFSDGVVTKRARAKKNDVVEAFKRLCVDNLEFKRAIEQTTKTPWATQTRLALWGSALAGVVDMRLDKQTMRLVAD